MPSGKLLPNPIGIEHAQELLLLQKSEMERLLKIHQQARAELIGRLSSLPGKKFTAQQTRIALAQTEIAIREMLVKLGNAKSAELEKLLSTSIGQTLKEISFFDPDFKQAQGRIQTRALRKIAQPQNLLLHKYQSSMNAYGGQLVGEMQRRVAVHVVKKSTFTQMALDLGTVLGKKGVNGARWKAERIVRTEMIDALNTGHHAALVEAATELDDLKKQWDSTLDLRTSRVCTAIHGQVKELHETWTWKGRVFAHPPAIPNCRSRISPYRQDWEDELEDSGLMPKGPAGSPYPQPKIKGGSAGKPRAPKPAAPKVSPLQAAQTAVTASEGALQQAIATGSLSDVGVASTKLSDDVTGLFKLQGTTQADDLAAKVSAYVQKFHSDTTEAIAAKIDGLTKKLVAAKSEYANALVTVGGKEGDDLVTAMLANVEEASIDVAQASGLKGNKAIFGHVDLDLADAKAYGKTVLEGKRAQALHAYSQAEQQYAQRLHALGKAVVSENEYHEKAIALRKLYGDTPKQIDTFYFDSGIGPIHTAVQAKWADDLSLAAAQMKEEIREGKLFPYKGTATKAFKDWQTTRGAQIRFAGHGDYADKAMDEVAALVGKLGKEAFDDLDAKVANITIDIMEAETPLQTSKLVADARTLVVKQANLVDGPADEFVLTAMDKIDEVVAAVPAKIKQQILALRSEWVEAEIAGTAFDHSKLMTLTHKLQKVTGVEDLGAFEFNNLASGVSDMVQAAKVGPQEKILALQQKWAKSIAENGGNAANLPNSPDLFTDLLALRKALPESHPLKHKNMTDLMAEVIEPAVVQYHAPLVKGVVHEFKVLADDWADWAVKTESAPQISALHAAKYNELAAKAQKLGMTPGSNADFAKTVVAEQIDKLKTLAPTPQPIIVQATGAQAAELEAFKTKWTGIIKLSQDDAGGAVGWKALSKADKLKATHDFQALQKKFPALKQTTAMPYIEANVAPLAAAPVEPPLVSMFKAKWGDAFQQVAEAKGIPLTNTEAVWKLLPAKPNPDHPILNKLKMTHEFQALQKKYPELLGNKTAKPFWHDEVLPTIKTGASYDDVLGATPTPVAPPGPPVATQAAATKAAAAKVDPGFTTFADPKWAPKQSISPNKVTLPNGKSAERFAGSTGSNAGGFYRTADGEEWFIKFPGSTGQVGAESLGGKLAAKMGLGTKGDYVHFEVPGGVAIASKKVSLGNLTQKSIKQWADQDELTDHFLHAAWTRNWDVIGLDSDNMAVVGGKLVTVDYGGGLLWRAQGQLKMGGLPSVVEELKTMRTGGPKQNTAAQVFGHLGDLQVAKRVQATIANITDADIHALVQAGDFHALNAKAIYNGLRARRDYLVKWADKVAGPVHKPKVAAIPKPKVAAPQPGTATPAQIQAALIQPLRESPVGTWLKTPSGDPLTSGGLADSWSNMLAEPMSAQGIRMGRRLWTGTSNVAANQDVSLRILQNAWAFNKDLVEADLLQFDTMGSVLRALKEGYGDKTTSIEQLRNRIANLASVIEQEKAAALAASKVKLAAASAEKETAKLHYAAELAAYEKKLAKLPARTTKTGQVTTAWKKRLSEWEKKLYLDESVQPKHKALNEKLGIHKDEIATAESYLADAQGRYDALIEQGARPEGYSVRSRLKTVNRRKRELKAAQKLYDQTWARGIEEMAADVGYLPRKPKNPFNQQGMARPQFFFEGHPQEQGLRAQVNDSLAVNPGDQRVHAHFQGEYDLHRADFQDLEPVSLDTFSYAAGKNAVRRYTGADSGDIRVAKVGRVGYRNADGEIQHRKIQRSEIPTYKKLADDADEFVARTGGFRAKPDQPVTHKESWDSPALRQQFVDLLQNSTKGETTVTWNAPTSASSTGQWSGELIYRIHGEMSGTPVRSISSHASENEVLFASGSTFVIDDFSITSSRIFVDVREVFSD